MYYLTTYIVEHSNWYMREQKLLDCENEMIDK